MRIVIDLQSSQSGSRLGGIGRYSVELAKAMARRAGDHELWIVLNSLLPNAIAETRHTFSNLIPQDRIRIFETPRGIAERKNSKAKVRAAEFIRENFLRSLNPDIIHISSLFEGYLEDVVTSVGQLYSGEHTAVTLYDLIPLVQREKYLADNDTYDYYIGKIENLKKSGLLLSISEFSKKEAVDVLGIDPNKVVNISSAADKRFRPFNVSQQDSVELLTKFGISRKFLMYTGSFDQRKNQSNLIKAFGLLPTSVRKNYQLLIVGNGWDGIYRELAEVAKKSGLSSDDLVFAGHVTDAELLPLYNLCHLFVFPSLAEGFGLPVLEAMSCGTPTIGSNCTSIPEVIGWADALFDPRSPESIAKTMHLALTDKEFMKMLSVRGIEQAKNFSWDESARRAINAFEAHQESTFKYGNTWTAFESKRSGKNLEKEDGTNYLIENLVALEGVTSLPDEALLEISQSIASNNFQASSISAIENGQTLELKTGWVTTWNTRCGIAAYSRFLVESFPANVKIFAPDTIEKVQEDEGNVTRCWKSGTLDDLNRLLLEVKNSDVKVLIVQFNFFFFEYSSLDFFLREVISQGIRVFVIFHSTTHPYDYKNLSFLKEALSICQGLIVHTLKDVENLRGLGLSHNINYMPQGVISKTPSKVPFKNIGEKRVISTYGFALPSKGLMEVVDAFSKILRNQGSDYHLLMVNSEYPDPISKKLIEDIKKRIVELGIEDNVSLISEYLNDEESLGYLNNSDLIIYAYQETGESSSAAVRMGLAAKRPVAVTPNPIFEDVKSSVFLLPGSDSDAIAKGIETIFKQIDQKTVSAIDVNEGATTWIKSHLYSSLAKHLFWIMARPEIVEMNYIIPSSYALSLASGPVIFSALRPELKTSVGKISPNGIETTGSAGHLVFGPYVSVAPGTYKVLIKGQVRSGGVGLSSAKVVMKNGTFVLNDHLIKENTENNLLADIVFKVPDGGCTDLEVPILVDANSDFTIFEIEFQYLGI